MNIDQTGPAYILQLPFQVGLDIATSLNPVGAELVIILLALLRDDWGLVYEVFKTGIVVDGVNHQLHSPLKIAILIK